MGGALTKPIESLKKIYEQTDIECDKLELLDDYGKANETTTTTTEDTVQQKVLAKKLRSIIKKYRYRSREIISTVLQQEADEIRGGQLITRQNTIPAHMQPDRIKVQVSMSQRHQHPNIDQENCNGCTVVESKANSQWWRCNLPFEHTQVEEIVDRISKGMHSLVISQSSTDQSLPKDSSTFAFDPRNPGTFIQVYRRMKEALAKNKNIESPFLNVRIIGQHVNPRTTDQLIVLMELPTRDNPIGVWETFQSPVLEEELNIYTATTDGHDNDDDVAFAVLQCIQSKHEELESSSSVEKSMLTRFSAPGRLSGGNGPGCFVRTNRNHTNWIVQMIVPSFEEPFELYQRRHESSSQRLIRK